MKRDGAFFFLSFFEVAPGETAGFKHCFSFSAEANDYSKP